MILLTIFLLFVFIMFGIGIAFILVDSHIRRVRLEEWEAGRAFGLSEGFAKGHTQGYLNSQRRTFCQRCGYGQRTPTPNFTKARAILTKMVDDG